VQVRRDAHQLLKGGSCARYLKLLQTESADVLRRGSTVVVVIIDVVVR